MTRRYALYFVPAATHPLWRAGCDWLARDPETGASGAVPSWRAGPRRYGFHATLKPPFALRRDADEAALEARLSTLVAGRAAFDVPPLRVATLGDFLALRPGGGVEAGEESAAAAPLRALADACIGPFDALRRPPGAAEISRRMKPGLTAPQRDNLQRWGYPYVFESWRFHMTLTDDLPRDNGGQSHSDVRAEAERHFASALAVPLRCDGVALFIEDAPGADFRLLRRFGFAR